MKSPGYGMRPPVGSSPGATIRELHWPCSLAWTHESGPIRLPFNQRRASEAAHQVLQKSHQWRPLGNARTMMPTLQLDRRRSLKWSSFRRRRVGGVLPECTCCTDCAGSAFRNGWFEDRWRRGRHWYCDVIPGARLRDYESMPYYLGLLGGNGPGVGKLVGEV